MSWSRPEAGASVLALAFGVALLVAERRWPLRGSTHNQVQRLPSNLVHGALAGVAHALTTAPVTRALVERYPCGIGYALPAGIRPLATFVLLDLTFWAWHLANHQLRPLWSLHVAHHRDPDMDMTTAVRFHPAEILLGALHRAAQIIVIGPTRRDLALYDAAFQAAVLFHHSNVRVPGDHALSAVLVTPRTHGIHHDLALGHTNLGVVLTIWDRVFGTYARDIPQEVLHIGALPLVATRHTSPPPAVRLRPRESRGRIDHLPRERVR